MQAIGGSLARAVGAAYPLILLATVWEAVARLGYVRAVFLPPLSTVVAQFWPLAVSGELVWPLVISLYRTAAGLAVALVAGIFVGFLMARVRVIRWLLDPLIAFSFPSPKVAFLPVFILWFGIDHLSKIALVAFTCVFPFIIAAYAGATTVPTHQVSHSSAASFCRRHCRR
jgi:ABC-type nitrate/sulfonate/bicarbonate transport system permease component